ncbi:MAG: hypothetical protein CVU77_06190 [Elusimicrobia bacterium HGW-Elusimicrobia-1]|jgi:RNase H-fold protein (predicted Holliday junction resolvase)|nr:MAG: hypothetical protein CVU79_08230 [Elusimicrobia bacterium HGW-Elusimicrobia-3]PKN01267.1 MAG: hypothetical protein CVU77_06190 [Elusimicrobia bacterium HGW-Elusimicrobia-1]
MTKKIISAAVLALFFASTGFAAPEWLSGQSKKYPAAGFITGVGAGSTMDSSRDVARAEIAKAFSMRIEQATVETSSERSSEATGGRAEISVDVVQKTESKVVDTVEGVEIAQMWYDKKDKVYWALAVLDKAKYRRELSLKILSAEEKVMKSLESARQTMSFAEKLKNLSEARSAASVRDGLYLRRRVVDDMPSPPLPDDLSFSSIESEIADAKSRTTFRVNAADGLSGEFAVELTRRLTKLGFAVVAFADGASTDSASVSMDVDARFDVSEFSRATQVAWKYYRWEGRVEVRDSGKVIIAAAASGSESNPDDKTAFQKARIAGLKILGDLFERKIKNDFLGGE